MKAISTKPFNALGIISPEKGMVIDTKSAVTIAQLKNMGFVEVVESEQQTEQKAKKTKKASK